MFIDLHVPFPTPIAYANASQQHTPGGKGRQGKQRLQASATADASTSASAVPVHPLDRLRPPDRAALRQRVEMLIHLGYTLLAFTQPLASKLDPATHVNWFAGGGGTVFRELDPRFNGGKGGAVQLRRLEVVLDEASEKGFGFNAQTAPLLAGYDLLSLRPTTASTFQAACLQHTLPSPYTVHLLSLPLAARPRLPFYMKHSLVRTALTNGARFEIAYAGALAGGGAGGGGGGGGEDARAWWTNAREVARVAAGGRRDGHHGVVFSSGAGALHLLRAPGDVMNLATTLGLSHETAHAALAHVPRALVIRAETRRTYRAMLSEPRLVFPGREGEVSGEGEGEGEGGEGERGVMDVLHEEEERGRKRALEGDGDGRGEGGGEGMELGAESDGDGDGPRRRRKRRRKNR